MNKKKNVGKEFKFKYRLLLQKRYFDTGLGLTNYIKYLIAFFGLASSDIKTTLWIALTYGVACYFIGRIWFLYNWPEIDMEISNNYNLFVKEMRRKI